MKKITAEFELKTGKTKDDLGDIQDGLKGVEKGLDAAGKEGKKTNKILKGISNLFKGALGLGRAARLFTPVGLGITAAGVVDVSDGTVVVETDGD